MDRAIKCLNFCSHNDKNLNQFYYHNKILKINDLFKLELGKFMYKYDKKLLPESFNPYFESIQRVHSYNTIASNENYFIPRVKSNKGLCTLHYLGAKMWSEIPIVAKNTKFVRSFTSKYRKILLDNYLIE